MLLRLAANYLSGSGASARLLILMYHRVLAQTDPLMPDNINTEEFSVQMQLLEKRYRPFTLSEAIRRLSDHSLPSRSVVVTFDDGYRDNYDVALPILQRHSIPATFFVASGFLGGGRMWNDSVIEAMRRVDAGVLDLTHLDLGCHTIFDDGDRVAVMRKLIGELKYHPMDTRQSQVNELVSVVGKPLPDNLMMNPDQVQILSDVGMEIGGHTRLHPILSRIDLAQAEKEIIAGRDYLQDIIGSRISVFAYPNGRPGQDYQREHMELLRLHGFDSAVSTSWGCVTGTSDRLQLPRIAPWDRTRMKFNLRLLRAYRQPDADYV